MKAIVVHMIFKTLFEIYFGSAITVGKVGALPPYQNENKLIKLILR